MNRRCCRRYDGPMRHQRAARYFVAVALLLMAAAAAINLYFVL